MTMVSNTKVTFTSRLFRNLVNICLIPLEIEWTDKQVTFKMCSKSTAGFIFYQIISVAVSFSLWQYVVGISKLVEFWKNMINQSNSTDFITYVTFIAMNMFGLFHFKFFKDFTKVSKSLILSEILPWPKHGGTLVGITVLNIIACICWGVFTFKARVEINFTMLIGVILSYSFGYLYSFFILSFLNLLILSWLELFSLICDTEGVSNVYQHSKKCLRLFKSLQDGLETTFFAFFASIQILIVISVYMCISTAFFGPYEFVTNIVVSICYLQMFLFCSIVIFVLTTSAENAYSSLRNLIKPLNLMVMKETDEEVKMNVQMLLKDLEQTPPLHGCGYFVLTRGTLTSIVSNTVTSLIILLQFRNS